MAASAYKPIIKVFFVEDAGERIEKVFYFLDMIFFDEGCCLGFHGNNIAYFHILLLVCLMV